MCYYIGARKKETNGRSEEFFLKKGKGGTVPRSKYSDPVTRSNAIGNTP